jgi:hypothetical protein
MMASFAPQSNPSNLHIQVELFSQIAVSSAKQIDGKNFSSSDMLNDNVWSVGFWRSAMGCLQFGAGPAVAALRQPGSCSVEWTSEADCALVLACMPGGKVTN